MLVGCLWHVQNEARVLLQVLRGSNQNTQRSCHGCSGPECWKTLIGTFKSVCMHSRSNGYQASLLGSDPMTFLKHEQLQWSIVYLATWQFLILMENAKMLYYNAQARINEVFKSIVWETWGKMQPCFASYFRGKYSLR